MANIFEELMQSHMALTESLDSRKKSRCNCKKFSSKRFKVESLKIFEGADFDELDADFAVDPEEANENEDEVVLIIDPELPTDEEVPEDAAENLVGDFVYKCPICGANYVCDPNSESEYVSLDENGVPTECPVCGEDTDQILVGEIAPAEEVEGDEERELEPQEVEDEEKTEVEVDRDEDIFREEGEEFIEDSLKPQRKTESKKVRRPRKTRKAVKEDIDEFKDEVEDTDEFKVEDEFKDEVVDEVKVEDETKVKIDAETVNVNLGEGKKSKACKGKDCKEDETCEEACEKESKLSNRKLRRPITKTEGTRRPTAKVSPSRINRTRAIQEAKKASVSRKTSSKSNRPFTFKEDKFESMMTKMIRENYKTKDSFKVNRVQLVDGKLALNYSVGKRNGTFVAEGFDKNASRMKLRIKDKGVFTESYTKTPSFILECVCVNKSVIPTKIRYNFTKRVNESLYRVRGDVK